MDALPPGLVASKTPPHLNTQQQPLQRQPADQRLRPPSTASPISDATIRSSWTQCCISIFAYTWLLSNYFRTGSASDLHGYQTIEPNVYINFGPYAYPVNTFYKEVGSGNVTTAEDIAEWSYKYDTTSLAMRAFADFLNVSAFPECVLYRGSSRCPGDVVSPATGFTMLDALVEAVRSNVTAQEAKARRYRSGPATVLLRAQHDYFDRIHHYLLPGLFASPLWRTCQALYYSPELLSSASSSSSGELSANSNGTLADICSKYAYGGLRPYFCDELWTTFSRSCRPDDLECVAIGRVSVHLAARLQALRAKYWNATVDMLLIEGSRDLAIHRGGTDFVGKRDFDVVTIFRVRSCSAVDDASSCKTVLVDEYRYEGETFATDVGEWHSIVAALRGAAQAYYWIRLAALYVGCYFARAGRKEDPSSPAAPLSFARTCRAALVVFFKIPSQVIIYGSAFPLACYLVAHAIDSPMVYELIAQKFDSLNGLLQLSVMELVTVSSIQMRNVWVLASTAHVVVFFSTQRSWSPLQGIASMPQFSIALISSLTIVSQFRFISIRWTPVTRIQQVGPLSRIHPLVESFLGSTYGGGGKSTLGGIFLDVKAVGCSTTVLVVLATLCSLILRRLYPQAKLVFWKSYSYTPLTAGVLWPTTAFAVSWNDDLFQFGRIENALLHRRVSIAIAPLTRALPLSSLHSSSSSSSSALMAMSTDSLCDRSEAAEATLYLMNIAMLTDPIVFLIWRSSLSRTQIVVVRCVATERIFFVPLDHTAKLNWDGFTWLRIVPVNKLRWVDVITCG